MVLKRRIIKIIVLVIVAWVVVAAVAPRALVVSAPLASADVIVVLSGSSAYLERTQKAAQLYREGRAPLVVLTDDHTRGGWDSAQQRNPFFVERATEELVKAGVPRNRIDIVRGFAGSTHDEAVILKEYAMHKSLRNHVIAPDINSVLVVTSAYHSRRALRTLQQTFAGTDVKFGFEPASGDSLNAATAFWWLQPQGWRTVGGEYAKLIYYWFKYE